MPTKQASLFVEPLRALAYKAQLAGNPTLVASEPAIRSRSIIARNSFNPAKTTSLDRSAAR
jgi:hypothetical protein